MESNIVTVTLNPALDKTVEIDRLKPGGLNRISSIRIDPGGKGINVAKVLKNFGVNVIATGIAGGYQGKQLLEFLKKLQLKTNFTEIDGETRVNLKVLDLNSNAITEFNESGLTVSQENLQQFDSLIEQQLSNANILVLGGSIPPGIHHDIYKKYIEIANDHGIITILDADGEALKQGIEGIPYAIKPNIHELEYLYGTTFHKDTEVMDAAKEIIKKGIKLIVVSMGAKGSIVVSEQEAYSVKPFKINVQSTVGAGDSMVAALAYSLLEKHDLYYTSKWITAAGTITASKPGTQVCTLQEVIDHVDRVEVSKL